MQRSGHKGIDFASVAGGVVEVVVDKGLQRVPERPTATAPPSAPARIPPPVTISNTPTRTAIKQREPSGERLRGQGRRGRHRGRYRLNTTGKFHPLVHLKAFGQDGTVTAENKPARSGTPNDNRSTNVASHFRGCMNFVCSLPSDISRHGRCRSSPAAGSTSPIIQAIPLSTSTAGVVRLPARPGRRWAVREVVMLNVGIVQEFKR